MKHKLIFFISDQISNFPADEALVTLDLNVKTINHNGKRRSQIKENEK